MTAEHATTTPADCCSAFYEQDWVRRLAADSFHPGGEALSRRTVAAMGLPRGARFADLGCGSGTTALMLARESGLEVSGVDVGQSNIERAVARSRSEHLSIDFVTADARSLPYGDNRLDGVLVECAYSLFGDKPAALAEVGRVLRPGGRLAVTDMAVGGPLPADLAEIVAPWTCLADAMDEDAYLRGFTAAGFAIEQVADESGSLTQLLRDLKRRLLLWCAGELFAGCAAPRLDPAEIRHWLERVRTEVERGTIRYLRFHLRAPAAGQKPKASAIPIPMASRTR